MDAFSSSERSPTISHTSSKLLNAKRKPPAVKKPLPPRQASGAFSTTSTRAPCSRADRAAHMAALPPPTTITSTDTLAISSGPPSVKSRARLCASDAACQATDDGLAPLGEADVGAPAAPERRVRPPAFEGVVALAVQQVGRVLASDPLRVDFERVVVAEKPRASGPGRLEAAGECSHEAARAQRIAGEGCVARGEPTRAGRPLEVRGVGGDRPGRPALPSAVTLDSPARVHAR